MTKTIEQEALDLINEVLIDARMGKATCRLLPEIDLAAITEALCRALEAHAATKSEFEAHRREASEAARAAMAMLDEMSKPLLMGRNVKERLEKAREGLAPLILPKPDPLVEVISEVDSGPGWEDSYDYAQQVLAALAARGLEIREKPHD